MVFCAACTRTTLSHDHLEILNKAHKLAIGIDMKELLAVYGFAAGSQHDNKLSTNVRASITIQRLQDLMKITRRRDFLSFVAVDAVTMLNLTQHVSIEVVVNGVYSYEF